MFLHYVHCHFDFDYILFLAGEERESYVRSDFKLYIIFLPLQKSLRRKIFIFSYKSCKHNICIKKKLQLWHCELCPHTDTYSSVWKRRKDDMSSTETATKKLTLDSRGPPPPPILDQGPPLPPFLDCKLLLLFCLHVCSFFYIGRPQI